jgi:hypothetical protein
MRAAATTALGDLAACRSDFRNVRPEVFGAYDEI